MVIVAAAADMEPSSGEENLKALPWVFSPVPARGEGPGSASAKLWGAGADEETQFLPWLFVTASGQDGAGSPWGAGGEARPPPPQRMWPGCIPVGFGSDPGWCGGGERAWAEETVVRSALAAWRGRDDCLRTLPLPPYSLQLRLPGESPGGTLLLGCDGCWWRRRFGALFSYLPFSLQSTYVRWQVPNVGVAINCESLRATGLSEKERLAGPQRQEGSVIFWEDVKFLRSQ